MICIKCGAEIPAGAKFCPNCGSPAEITPEDMGVDYKETEDGFQQVQTAAEQTAAAADPDHPVPHLELASDMPEPPEIPDIPEPTPGPAPAQHTEGAKDPFADLGKPPVYPQGGSAQGTYSQPSGAQTGGTQQDTYHQTNPQQGNASQVFSGASAPGSAYSSGDRSGSFAIVALILSILGGVLCCIPVISPLLSLGGLVLGILGLKSDRKTMAIVAIIISGIFLLLGGATSLFSTVFASRINTGNFDINQFINDLEQYTH